VRDDLGAPVGVLNPHPNRSWALSPSWTKTVALVREHAALREAIGGECPSVYAAYRFAAKLRAYSDLLDSCIARVLDRLHRENPDFGRDPAIDASDLPAYANGQRYLSKRYSDPEELGSPLGRLDAQGRRLLRIPRPRRRVCADGPSSGLAGRDRR
jgi:hypothetical protein